jgi:hypothetical protein
MVTIYFLFLHRRLRTVVWENTTYNQKSYIQFFIQHINPTALLTNVNCIVFTTIFCAVENWQNKIWIPGLIVKSNISCIIYTSDGLPVPNRELTLAFLWKEVSRFLRKRKPPQAGQQSKEKRSLLVVVGSQAITFYVVKYHLLFCMDLSVILDRFFKQNPYNLFYKIPNNV